MKTSIATEPSSRRLKDRRKRIPLDYRKITGINDQLNDRYVAENAWEEIATYPKLVTLTTTLRCNYRCWMCYQREFSGDLDWRIVERLERVLPYAKSLQLFGGEPLLYGRIRELCELAGRCRCELDIITNGSLLDAGRRSMLLDNNVHLVKISLEAATRKTYQSIRNGDLDRVLGNMAALANEKTNRGLDWPELQVNFVAMRRNIEELPAFVRIAAEVGVIRLVVLFMNCGSREDLARESLFFHQELADRNMAEAVCLGRELGVDVVVPGLFAEDLETETGVVVDTTCHSPWKNCLVDLNGTVRFCCGGAPDLGNLLDNEFDELWHCDRISRFRRLVNTPDQPSCCNTCRVKSRNFHDISFHVRNPALADRLVTQAAG